MIRHTLLKGLVGSKAYGLGTPTSDDDYLSVYAVPTEQTWTLDGFKETVVEKDPDHTGHEAIKFALLALKCNPTAMELLWLPRENYVIYSELGQHLIDIRHAFLCREAVHEAYLGYAKQQLLRMDRQQRRDEADEEAVERRIAKNARHMARLLLQLADLEVRGTLRLNLGPNADFVRELGEQAVANNRKQLWELLENTENLCKRDANRSMLPLEQDKAMVDYWLTEVRLSHQSAKLLPLAAQGW